MIKNNITDNTQEERISQTKRAMFARLCKQTLNEDPKRRHSWSSETDYQFVGTKVAANISGENSASSLVDLKNDRISYKEHGRSLQTMDLVADCPLQIVTDSSSRSSLSFSTLSTFLPSSTYVDASATSMGQRSSALLRPKISLTWVLRGQQQQSGANGTYPTTNGNGNANSDRDLLSRGSKERSSGAGRSLKCFKEKDVTDDKENIENKNKSVEKREKKILHRFEKMERIEETISKEPISERRLESTLEKYFDKEFVSLKDIKEKEKVKRAISEPSLVSHESMSTTFSGREKHRHRRIKRSYKSRLSGRFGYEIADLDAFLTKASIERPANIPVVLSFPSVLYQTQGGIQDEMALPLGTVVNAIFKNQAWLYVQTPHGQEGYVGYAACLPLGILPHPTRGPCWEDSTDIFPQPLGNMTDTEKLRDTRSECGASRGRSGGRVRRCTTRDALSACGERSVDRLYLKAAANVRTKHGSRHTLLPIGSDYEAGSANALTVYKGDVVALLSDRMSDDWFWVRSRDGKEGFIPAFVAGHGFL